MNTIFLAFLFGLTNKLFNKMSFVECFFEMKDPCANSTKCFNFNQNRKDLIVVYNDIENPFEIDQYCLKNTDFAGLKIKYTSPLIIDISSISHLINITGEKCIFWISEISKGYN